MITRKVWLTHMLRVVLRYRHCHGPLSLHRDFDRLEARQIIAELRSLRD